VDKNRQIEIMNKIYQGAWVTIVALGATSAHSGIPRIRPNSMLPLRSNQASCVWNGTRLMATLPTLSQQAAKSKWQTRAWTYQEAILSPRCLFFTEDQVYFECNSIQCCESIDESNSAYHQIPATDRLSMLYSCVCHGGSQNAIGKGVFRDPLATSRVEREWLTKKNRFERYAELVEVYSTKEMTFSSDTLNALSGVLQQLTYVCFPAGCYWGLPVDILPFALLWQHRGSQIRRLEFPSWSWAGWKGELFSAGINGSSTYQPPFKAWRAETTAFNTELVLLYEDPQKRWEDWAPGYDPILDMASTSNHASLATLTLSSGEDLSQTLFVEAIVFEPQNLLDHSGKSPSSGQWEVFGPNTVICKINQVTCMFWCQHSQTKRQFLRGNPSLLLIGRKWYSYVGWGYDFLLICPITGMGGDKAVRLGRVRMHFGPEYTHNESCHMVFTAENSRLMLIGLL